MKLLFFKKSVLPAGFIILINFLYAVPATVNIDYNTNISSFNPRYIYGSNHVVWRPASDFIAVKDKLAASGTYFIRHPGGSFGDKYHWNGTGSYDGNGIWHPSNTTWTKGFTSALDYRNTNAYDGNTATEWRSITETSQAYIWLRLGSSQAVDSVTINWGMPYAVNYEIQYWNSTSVNWAPHTDSVNHWVTVLSVTGATGGIDTRAIPTTTARVFRILMTQSVSAGFAIKEVELYNGATKRTITSSAASPTNRSNHFDANFWNSDFETYMAFMQSLGPQAVPYIIVNCGSGIPDEAAAWVYYANVVKGYNIKHWEIGNELGGAWEEGGPLDAQEYTQRFISFAEAMKAVDPTIKIYGPTNGLDEESQLYDGVKYAEKFLQILSAQGKMSLLDGLSHHEYPFYNNDDQAISLQTPSKWAAWETFVEGLFSTYCGGPQAKELVMSEYNSGSTTEIMTMQVSNALWVANWLGEFIMRIGANGRAQIWDIMNGNISAGEGDHGMLEAGFAPSPYTYQERPDYWAIYMMHNYFSVPDEAGNSIVSASSDQTLLPVYACKRSDGKLSLMAINKSLTDTYNAMINISNFSVDPNADVWTWGDTAAAPYYIDNWNWVGTANPPYADIDLPPNHSAINFAGNSFSFDFAPYTITIFNFVPSGATATDTSTITETPTPTVTFTDTPDTGDPTRYNFEDGTTMGWIISGNASNLINTTSNAYLGTHSVSIDVSLTGGGWQSGEIRKNSEEPQGIMTARIYLPAGAPSNISGGFYVQESITWTWHQGPWTALVPGTWNAISFDLSTETFANPITRVGVQVASNNAFTGTVYIDSINYLLAGEPTWTETQTPVATLTWTEIQSDTYTRTPTDTMTYTPTDTLSLTATETPTYTATFTDTHTDTSTTVFTDTETPSYTRTETPSQSFTDTATQTETHTRTETATPFFTSTGTNTATETPTETPAGIYTPSAGAPSQLFPYNGSTGKYEEQTVNFDGKNWRLSDFSYAGYKRGEVPLRDGVPCNVVTVSGSGDITAELQSLINSLSATGGIVRIPAGNYTISSTVGIFYDNISVEGAGSGNTIITVPSSWTPDEGANTFEGVFNIEPNNTGWHKGWIENGTILSQVTNVINEGDTYITGLTNLSNVNAGDWVVIQQYFWQQLVLDNSAGTWTWGDPGSRTYSFTYLRQVTGKDASGIYVDIPIQWTLDPTNNTIYIKRSGPSQDMIANSGISGISIIFQNNNNGTANRPAGAGIYWEGALNSWAYDVKLYNFPRFGFYPQSSARISIIDCVAKKTQDYGGDGYGYGFHISDSQSVLMKRCTGEDMRHSFILQHPLSNYVVMTDCNSIDIRLGDDTHHSFCHGILRDNYRMSNGNKLMGFNRGTTSGNAYETLGSGVFWNVFGDGYGGIWEGAQIEIKPSPYGKAIMSGGPGYYRVYDNTTGNPYTQGDPIPIVSGLQTGISGLKNVLYENLSLTQPVAPLSLYETQLWNRLGGPPPDDWDTSCGTYPGLPAATPTPDTGPGIHVYNSDHAGWGVSFGSGAGPLPTTTLQPGSNLDDAGYNHTDSGIESIHFESIAGDWGVMLNMGGPVINTADITGVEMYIYPHGTTTLDFRWQLIDDETKSVYGTVIVDGTYTDMGSWVADAWNRVFIPVSDFGYSGDFNGMMMRGATNTNGKNFQLDDIKILTNQTPTYTPIETWTQTETQMETWTYTETETPFFTETGTSMSTNTETATESSTETPTDTYTATETVTGTPPATWTNTDTPTETATDTDTVLFTQTETETETYTYTRTNTPTMTETPVFSGSGSVLFCSDRTGNWEIFIRDLATGVDVNITNNPGDDLNPNVSPDGSYAVFVSDRDGDAEIYRIDLSDYSVIKLTDNIASDWDPAYSPDGSKIVFKSNRDDGFGDIFIMNADGTGQANITSGMNATEEWDPSFTRDGTQVVFVSRMVSGDPNSDEIYIMNGDGTGINRITSNFVPDWYPSVKPDSDTILFISRESSLAAEDVYTTDYSGSVKNRITYAQGDDNDPSYSPDGTQIIYINNNDGDYDIYIMDSSGANPAIVENTSSNELCPVFIPQAILTPTDTVTQASTATGTLSETKTAANTQTPTFSPSNTATYTVTSALGSYTPTYTPTSVGYTPTPSATEADTFEFIKDEPVILFPNPAVKDMDIGLKFSISKKASYLTLRIYTVAARLICEVTLAHAMNAGENIVYIDKKYFADLSRGVYYYVVIVHDEEKEVFSPINKMIILY